MDWNALSASVQPQIIPSLSSRRAWIEIGDFKNDYKFIISSLSSRRAWIEITNRESVTDSLLCRSPHGERGLKFWSLHIMLKSNVSLSSRRAWIEIRRFTFKASAHYPSLSSRRAWIEMLTRKNSLLIFTVALLTESVDWNLSYRRREPLVLSRSPHGERGLKYIYIFYLIFTTSRSPHGERGLKYFLKLLYNKIFMSLSSRRAWIEIKPLKTFIFKISLSLSSRRAWIEIKFIFCPCGLWAGRSPHGERGLKFYLDYIILHQM